MYVNVCIFPCSSAVEVWKVVLSLKGDISVSISVYQEVYLCTRVCVCVCVALGRSSGEQYTPSPDHTHLNPSCSLVLIWSYCQLDWWLVEEKSNILIETLTCTGMHTHTHTRLFSASPMCTHKHTYTVYHYVFNFIKFPHTIGSQLVQTCIL